MVEQPRSILNDLQLSIHMNDDIILGGYDLAALSLLRIPRGRDVMLRSREDRQRFNCGYKVEPLLIGARKMSLQKPLRPGPAFEHHGKMRCKQTRLAHRHQRCKRLRLNQMMEHINSLL